ncbi:Farnesyl diphosphate synthase [Rosistilla ulvae]|uniref:Farnesyl diphosphate synthase n=1 Tax=Rosistilla ulvae TaxID=1930277 RepID=A0A517LVC8_9BACT|nr:farnesyl diphosphate synthase [Rosistilla ulvae]QDS86576.1 Farnesyl diphosphate synthase [Rosistilla ulvae]
MSNPASPAKNPLADLVPEIDAALDAALAPQEGCPPELNEAMRYSLMSPGKRLRPALVLMAAEACGGERSEAIAAAVAIEMVHAYSLIHDDLPAMDDDDLRRGRPTCHKQFDEATAILAGDALLTAAFETLATGIPQPERAVRACEVLAKSAGRSGMVGGQTDDLLAENRNERHNLAWLEAIHRRKTGALFTCSLQLGAISVGAQKSQIASLTDYARDLGLAFQIVDDLLDWEGDGDEMGKQSGKDAARGKLTFPGFIGVDASRSKASELVTAAKQHAELFRGTGQRLSQLADYVLQRSR